MNTNRQIRVILSLICVPFVLNPAIAQQNSPAEKARVEKVVADIIAADIAGDLDTIVSLYADDAILLSPNGPDTEGREAIRAHYEKLLGETALQIENETRETIVSGDLAVTRGINRVTARPVAGGPDNTSTDKYVMILEKGSGGDWRITHLIWTPVADQAGDPD